MGITWRAGYIKGKHEGQGQIYRDIVTAANLTASSQTTTPQLREYSKAQMYYYLAQHNINLIGRQMPFIDLGSVDEKLLSGTYPFLPHADAPNDYYHQWKD